MNTESKLVRLIKLVASNPGLTRKELKAIAPEDLHTSIKNYLDGYFGYVEGNGGAAAHYHWNMLRPVYFERVKAGRSFRIYVTILGVQKAFHCENAPKSAEIIRVTLAQGGEFENIKSIPISKHDLVPAPEPKEDWKVW